MCTPDRRIFTYTYVGAYIRESRFFRARFRRSYCVTPLACTPAATSHTCTSLLDYKSWWHSSLHGCSVSSSMYMHVVMYTYSPYWAQRKWRTPCMYTVLFSLLLMYMLSSCRCTQKTTRTYTDTRSSFWHTPCAHLFSSHARVIRARRDIRRDILTRRGTYVASRVANVGTSHRLDDASFHGESQPALERHCIAAWKHGIGRWWMCSRPRHCVYIYTRLWIGI